MLARKNGVGGHEKGLEFRKQNTHSCARLIVSLQLWKMVRECGDGHARHFGGHVQGLHS